jgi:phosphohistidine phosphatase SixA
MLVDILRVKAILMRPQTEMRNKQLETVILSQRTCHNCVRVRTLWNAAFKRDGLGYVVEEIARQGLGCSSVVVVEHLPSMYEALGSILRTTKQKEEKAKQQGCCVITLNYI